MALPAWLQKIRDAASNAAFKFQHRKAPEAAMAACALVAAATGGISADESNATIALAQGMPSLKAFPPADLAKLFMDYAKQINDNPVVGKVILLGAVGQVKGSEDASMVVNCAIAVGSSDGNFDDAEKGVARDIVNALGLSASSFAL